MGLPMPNRRVSSSGTGGSRTRRSPRFELGRFASLRTAPGLSQAPSTGFEPRAPRPAWSSCVTGRRALQAAPRGHVHVQVAQVGVEPTASLVLSQGGLPVAYRAEVVPDGVEPSFPGCGPSVVAAGPRDRGGSDEIRMTNVEGMSKSKLSNHCDVPYSTFVLQISFVISISSFVISQAAEAGIEPT